MSRSPSARNNRMIYFFSDSHIGSRADHERIAHQQKVVRMLHFMARDAEAIHIVGDLFDFWYEYLWPDKSKEEYTPILNTLRELVERGIKIHFYVGNHDLWTFGDLARKTGMIVHYERTNELEAYGRHILLGHGDGLVPPGYLDHLPQDLQAHIRHSIRINRIFRSRIAQALMRLCPPVWGNQWGYSWAAKHRIAEKGISIPYQGEANEALVGYAKEQEKHAHRDYYIFGHRHIELELELASRARVIILGDTFLQWTYARLTPDGIITTELYEE